MNRKQKVAVVIGLAVIGLMLLFPPWAMSDVQTGGLEFIGYSLFTGPPEPDSCGPWASHSGARVYRRRLMFQLAIAGVATAIFLALFLDREPGGSRFTYSKQ